jgi:hypothetical protein
MSTRIADGPSVSRMEAVESLKGLLNYAIAEGTDLGLPLFVSLLRMATLELTKSSGGQPRMSAPTLSRRGADAWVVP